MAREREGYREQLQALMERFPGRDVIELKEAAEFLGVCTRTLREDRNFPTIKIGNPRGNGPCKVTLVHFARWLTAESVHR